MKNQIKLFALLVVGLLAISLSTIGVNAKLDNYEGAKWIQKGTKLVETPQQAFMKSCANANKWLNDKTNYVFEGYQKYNFRINPTKDTNGNYVCQVEKIVETKVKKEVRNYNKKSKTAMKNITTTEISYVPYPIN